GSSNSTGAATPLGGPYTDEGDREGDWCSDTNPHATNVYDCTNLTGTNEACHLVAPTNPPVDNHMSYSFCSTTFTDQQSRRSHCMIDSYLASWTSYGGGICGTQPPVAEFIASPTTWNSPLIANFTDLSAPTSIIDSVVWIFDVAASNSVTCAGCTGTNARWAQDLTAVTTASTPPTVTYTNTGLYTVTLTVYSTNGNDTETKTDYIEVLTPAGDCDTLTTQWETPTPTVITYGFGGGWISGVPDPINMVLPTDPKGIYERYFTPSPGVTEVGAVRVGLGSLRDDDDDMVFQVVLYDDDGAGAPGVVVGGIGGISPTALGVPGPGFYNEFWIPFNAALVPTTGTFHVGVEIFSGGDATDTLVVMTSCLGPTVCAIAQGEADGSNHIWTTGYGYENFLTVYGADFDIDIIPMLGPWKPLPVITGFTENVVCDTTYVTLSDTAFYSDPVSWSFTFASDGAVLNYTIDPGTINRTYTSAGPDTVTIIAVNSCGRADTTSWVINYNFMTTPDADFIKDLPNPVCAGALATFTANTAGYSTYDWDFGDGTTLTGSSSETHTYALPGLYYTTLTVTSPGYQPSDTTFLENFEGGIPGTWTTLDNNGSVGNAGAIFDGSNATAWVDIDLDAAGDIEAWSTGWNNPTTTPSDDWLISPNIAIAAGNSLAWDGESFYALFPDAYEVYVVAGGASSVANCLSGQLVYSTGGENAFTTQHVVDLPSYGFTGGNIKVCYRNNSGGDQGYLAIDNVRVGTTGTGCSNTEQKLDFVEVVDCSTTPPVADGVADVVSGCGPLTVTYTDASTNTPTSWVWNFGDATFSTAQNPGAHVYTAPGTYFVSLQACNAGGCTTENFTVTVLGLTEDATYTYSSIAECQSGTDMTATVTGTLGGTFTSIPAVGMSLNAATGLVDVSATTPGSYNITYTTSGGPCAATSMITVTISADQNAAFSYASATYCQGGIDPTPTITGTAGGTFNALPAGLSLTAGTGAVDLSTSTPGAYTITYTTAGPCAANSNVAFTVTADEDPTYGYSSTTECQSGTDMTATITGTAGGTFTSAPAGLSINGTTGLVDVSASTAGVYTVTYTTPGTCVATSNIVVTISADEDASFTLSSANECQSGTDVTATITGTGGGALAFTSAPAGLSINGVTGAIDVSASAPGAYTVTYTTGGACSANTNQAITIVADEDPTYTYSSVTECQSGTDMTATITGTVGGTFTSAPAGLSINGATGLVDVSASAAGVYTVTYTTQGTCSATSNVVVTINVDEDASFTLSSANECQNGTDVTATITGTAAGAFTAAPAGLSINGTTGAIDVSASSPGVYTVTYTTLGACSVNSNQPITIVIDEDATYSFSTTTECQGGTDMTATITGTGGGTFTGAPAGLSINAGTGLIDVSASTAGVYTVTYTTPGTCTANSNIIVTINTDEDASFSYSAGTYCVTGADPLATITGTGGGVFTATGGLTINPGTGLIDLDVPGVGSYTVTYTTVGACPANSNFAVNITTAPLATFSYTGSPYCENGGTASVTFGAGASGGTFTALPAGLTLNAGTGDIDLNTSTPGTYTVTNDIAAAGGCAAANANTIVTIDPAEDASYTYSSTSECQSGTDLTVTITGTAGGTFTAAPAGLSLTAGTGAIDVSASTPGVYTVTYTTAGTCSDFLAIVVTILTDEDATYTYSSTTECQSGTDMTATVTGTGGGTFTATPAGLSINGTTGAIDVSASTAGVYNVTYTTPGTCSAALIIAVTIDADEDATYTLSSAAECQSGTDITATISGTGSGVFTSAPAGLSINGATGLIDVSASTPGVYTVTYTTPGTCSAFLDLVVTITAVEDATYTYSSTTECQSGTDMAVTITGTVGGTFTSAPAGLSVNASTGLVDVSASTAGVYNVTYTTPGACSANSVIAVTINADDDASFSYSAGTFCVSGTDPLATITGTAGGTFTATGGLTINSSTGLIDLNVSGVGAYTVTYTTGGVCPASSNAAVNITLAPDATFSYTGSPYCENGGTASVTYGAGASAGVFSILPAGGGLNTSTGDIDLSLLAPGVYTVSNDIVASGGCSAANDAASITVTALDDAGFSYASANYCQSDTDPVPTINLAGGAFTSAPAGLVINGATGDVDVSASTVGVYTVTYTTAGTCPNSSNASITINADDDATYTFSSILECQSGTDITATITGTAGGTFAGVPAGISLNGTTGDIDVSASTAGVYTVTYTTGGVCPTALAIVVTITADDDASFNYSSSSYCQATTDPAPFITGTAGGTFTSTPAGLIINATTGEVDLSASTLGSYTITYTTAGACPQSTNVTLDVTSIDDPSFSYTAGTSYCAGASNPIPTVTGTTGGTYSATPAGMIINAATGIIDLTGSTAGTYNVMYTTGGACSADSTIAITINATPSLDVIADVLTCGSFTLPVITGTDLSGNESYYDGAGATGTAFAAGAVISTSTTLFVFDSAGTCNDETSFIITIDTAPSTANAGTDATICDDILTQTLGANAATSGTGVWTTGTGSGTFVDNLDPVTNVSAMTLGANEYIWTISNGSCPASSDTVVITSESCDSVITISIPSGFTPDGNDITNATWEIAGLDTYSSCEVMIFNKWGNEIFTSTGYPIPWDGTYNNKALPVGAYYYVIKLNDAVGTTPYKGTVTIIK
ncbi:MAG: gliding motility-associated-like protein, partial [Parvicellaceae bacterium]